MSPLNRKTKIAVLGAGTMGSGIAQVAATHGHPVCLYDVHAEALEKARTGLSRILQRLAAKGRISESQADAILGRIQFCATPQETEGSGLVIEAVVENLDIKQEMFLTMENLIPEDGILATNTSSLSVASIASGCNRPERVLGAHFFNPAPLMPLVEIIPGLETAQRVIGETRQLIDAWGKTTVLAKDTPGFIVNRVARPFYGEAIRMVEEGVADPATVDWAMREKGGFRMGPFELMDFIGNDINLKVTETVYEAFFYDPRYRPSFTQKRLVEARRLGRKAGRGYYDYTENAAKPEPNRDHALADEVCFRILAMLINEAADAVFWRVATPRDIDLAMTKGVNYPKGLLAWGEEIGLARVLDRMRALQEAYGEDRYRPSPLLKRLVDQGRGFFN